MLKINKIEGNEYTYLLVENKLKKVKIYTDGACSGNPGPGGWGAILMYNDVKKEISGGDKNTTNNQMELLAVIVGLSIVGEITLGIIDACLTSFNFESL